MQHRQLSMGTDMIVYIKSVFGTSHAAEELILKRSFLLREPSLHIKFALSPHIPRTITCQI